MATSFEDVIVQFAAETGLSTQDVRDLLSPDLTDDDRRNLLLFYKDARAPVPSSGWTKVFAIMSDCAQVAGLVIPIAGAVEGVYGLTKLVTA